MPENSWSHMHGTMRVVHPGGVTCSWADLQDNRWALDYEPVPAVEKKLKWSIGVNAIVEGTDKANSMYWSLCALAREMRKTHGYVSVSSSLMDDVEVDEPAEFHDSGTMDKVRAAVKYAVLHHQGNIDRDIDTIITSLQNYGILFRERR